MNRRFESRKRQKGLATIEWRLTVLPEDLSKATRDFVLQFMPEGADASKLDEAMAQMKLEHIDRATYRIALADGVVRRMDRTAVVKAHDMENKTVVTMTLSALASRLEKKLEARG